MTAIANVALSNTFDYWRIRTNEAINFINTEAANTGWAVSNTTFQATLANTNSYIATKVNTSTFNSALANTNSYIATKVNTSTFNSALANTNSYIANTAAGAGDVNGPASSTDNTLVRWDGTTGKTIQNSGWVLSDAEALTAGGTIDMNGNELVTDISQFAVNAAGNSGISTLTLTKASKDLTTITATGDFTVDVTGGPDSGKVLSKRVRVTMDGTGARDITVQRESGSSSIYWPQNTADTTVALDTTAYGAGAIFDLWLEDDGSVLSVHYELIKAGA